MIQDYFRKFKARKIAQRYEQKTVVSLHAGLRTVQEPGPDLKQRKLAEIFEEKTRQSLRPGMETFQLENYKFI